MKPYHHSRISVKKFGGSEKDYQQIHDWFDSTKAHIADMRHRMVLHNSFGIFLCEQVFGTMEQKSDGTWVRMPYIINSDGNKVQVRDIAEQHVLDDLGHIPSLDKCFSGMEMANWMGLSSIKNKNISIKNLEKLNIEIVD